MQVTITAVMDTYIMYLLSLLAMHYSMKGLNHTALEKIAELWDPGIFEGRQNILSWKMSWGTLFTEGGHYSPVKIVRGDIIHR